MNIPITHLVLLIAAVWRLANLIAHEAGPSYTFARVRKWASKSKSKWVRKFGLVDLLNCEYCLSVWFGMGLSFAYGLTTPGSITGVGWFVVPLALSTGAIIIKHIVFLIKSVDARFDQQNQAYLVAKAQLEKRLEKPANYPSEYKIKLLEKQKAEILNGHKI